MKAVRLGWPTLPSRLVANILAGHSAVALALGALIYLVCLSGTLCVFIDELELWEQPTPAPSAFNPARSDQIVGQAIALVGSVAKAPVIFLRAPVTPRQRPVVSIGARQWAVTSSGALVPLRLPWTRFLAELHYTLTLPGPWGEMLVGLLGMGLLSLLISGVLAHPRVLRDAFVLRLGGARRLQEADLHNRLGVWGLPFHLAVTLTGALFGLANLLYLLIGALGFHGDTGRASAVLNGAALAADARPAPLPPLGRIVADARRLSPGSQLSYIGVAAPGTRGARVTVEVTAPGRLPRGDITVFDATGRPMEHRRYASGDLGLQLYSASVQVHVGVFGGLPVRMAYGILGLTLCWVSAGGTTIWLARRRDQGRPIPRLEHAWSACVWGAPIALALAAVPNFAGAGTTFWTTWLLALLSSQAPSLRQLSQETVDRIYRATLSLVMFVAVGFHPLGHSSNSVVVLTTLAILVSATGLALSCGLLRLLLGRREKDCSSPS